MRPLALTPLLLALAACASAHPPAPIHVAETPPCAPQVEPLAGGPGPIPGFGCATLANLQAMVADPRDLERGRAEVPVQGDGALMAIRRHDADALKLVITKDSADKPDLERPEQTQGPPK
jgi:hypothetical protein